MFRCVADAASRWRPIDAALHRQEVEEGQFLPARIVVDLDAIKVGEGWDSHARNGSRCDGHADTNRGDALGHRLHRVEFGSLFVGVPGGI